MSKSIEKNIEIWEGIYSSGQSDLKYPNEMLVRAFNKYKAKMDIKTVLDFGFGTGANLIHFIESGCEVSGVEVSGSAIQIAQKKMKEKNISADLKLMKDYKIPCENDSFDLVVAWQVLVYNDLESFKLTMKEITRVLKKGGIFIGTMTAIGDQTFNNSEKVGEYLYKSKVKEQSDAVCIIVDRQDLNTFFPGVELSIGEYFFNFEGSTSKHWVLVYEN